MKRQTKTVYTDDKGRELVSIKDGKAYIHTSYDAYAADAMDEIALICRAAAEELRATVPQEVGAE